MFWPGNEPGEVVPTLDFLLGAAFCGVEEELTALLLQVVTRGGTLAFVESLVDSPQDYRM